LEAPEPDEPAEAWRGEEGWTDYHVLADVRLGTDNAEANVYFRHGYNDDQYFPGFQYYTCILSYDGQQGMLRLVKHWLQPGLLGWIDTPLPHPPVTIPGFEPALWHLMEINVENVAETAAIQCYLDNDGDDDPLITYTDTGATYGYAHMNGNVGLAVGRRLGSAGNQTASFDNVIVLEE